MLVDGYASRVARLLDHPARVGCNRRLVEHWLYTVAKAEGRLADASITGRVRSRETLLRPAKLPTIELERRSPTQTPQPAALAGEPDTCDLVFNDTFPEIVRNMPPQKTPPQLCPMWPCDPVTVDEIELPMPKFPLLRLTPSLVDPVDDDATGRYRLRP